MMRKIIFTGVKVLLVLCCLSISLNLQQLTQVIANDLQVMDVAGSDISGNRDDYFTRSSTITYQLKGDSTIHNVGSDVRIDVSALQSFEAAFSFALTDLENPEDGVVRKVKANDYYTIELPKEIVVANQNETAIYGSFGNVLANYRIQQVTDSSGTHAQIRVVFAQAVDDVNLFDIKGNFSFVFTIDDTQLQEEQDTSIFVPVDVTKNTELKLYKPKPEAPATVTSLVKSVKDYNSEKRELTWSIQASGENGKTPSLKDFEMVDALDITYMEMDTVKVYVNDELANLGSGKGEYTLDNSTGELRYVFHDNAVAPLTILIKVEVKPVVYEITAADSNNKSTTIMNKAKLKRSGVDPVEVQSNQATKEIKAEWLSKKGSLVDGNRIEWEIIFNANKQYMADVYVYDQLGSDLLIEGVDAGTSFIKLKENNVERILPILAKDSVTDTTVEHVSMDENNNLVLYLGDDVKTNKTYTMKFITSVKPSDDSNVKDYTNTARIACTYYPYSGQGNDTTTTMITTPDITTSNVTMPNATIKNTSISKNTTKFPSDYGLTAREEFEKYGILTWELKAASNLNTYDRAKITDTIDTDQKLYRKANGKYEIYWQNETGTWIDIYDNADTSIVPSASVLTTSEGKEQVIIDYPKQNALKTQQTFIVRTEIIDYEDNLNQATQQDYHNTSEVFLYRNDSTSPIAKDEDQSKQPVKNIVIAKSVKPVPAKIPTMEYTITINENHLPLTGVNVEDDLNQIITNFKNASETDFTQIDGVSWKYVKDSLQISDDKVGSERLNLSTIIQTSNDAYDEEDNCLRISFGSGKIESKYTITFKTQLQDYQKNKQFAYNGEIACKGNIATLHANSGLLHQFVDSIPIAASATIKTSIVDKTGVFDSTSYGITWYVRINQHDVRMDNNNIVDMLPKGLTIDPLSIELYDDVIDNNGQFIANNVLGQAGLGHRVALANYKNEFDSVQGAYKATFTLPKDQTAYILKFTTDIDNAIIPVGTKVANTAFFEGKNDGKMDRSSYEVNVSSGSGGSSSKRSSITVFSKDAENTSDVLSNTKIGLYLKDVDGTYLPYREATTDASGKVSFIALKSNLQYYVKEIASTEGYENVNDKYIACEFNDINNPQPITKTLYDPKIKTLDVAISSFVTLKNKTMEEGVFAFEIVDEDGAVLFKGDNHIVDADGKAGISFQPINSTNNPLSFKNAIVFDSSTTSKILEEKTIIFRQIIPTEDTQGMQYDTREFTYYLTIQNDKFKDTLTCVVKDSEGNIVSEQDQIKSEELPVFENIYAPQGTYRFPSIKQRITGQPLAKNVFQLEVYEDVHGVKTLLQTTMNDENGVFHLSPMNFSIDDIGLHTYTIVQSREAKEGYTYDTSEYTITINVMDQGDGTMRIERVDASIDDEILFENTYVTGDTQYAIHAKKELLGATLENNQFEFVLSTNSEILETIKNDEDGMITSQNLEFSQDDMGKTFTYQLQEIHDMQTGIIYDEAVYTIMIYIEDNKDGTISPKVSMNEQMGGITSDTSACVFQNQYRETVIMQPPLSTPPSIDTNVINTTQAPDTGDNHSTMIYILVCFASMWIGYRTHKVIK